MKRIAWMLGAVSLVLVSFGETAVADFVEWEYELTADGRHATICKRGEGAKPLSGDIAIPSSLAGYSVTGIGEDAFAKCKEVTSVMFAPGLTQIGRWAFQDCDELKSVTFPASLAYMGNEVFADCTRLTKVTFQGPPPTWVVLGLRKLGKDVAIEYDESHKEQWLPVLVKIGRAQPTGQP